MQARVAHVGLTYTHTATHAAAMPRAGEPHATRPRDGCTGGDRQYGKTEGVNKINNNKKEDVQKASPASPFFQKNLAQDWEHISSYRNQAAAQNPAFFKGSQMLLHTINERHSFRRKTALFFFFLAAAAEECYMK